MDKINEYLRRTWNGDRLCIRQAIECADGFTISVQAGEFQYCSPRISGADQYENVELGFPIMEEPLIADYAEDPDDLTHTVYRYVPIEVVNRLIEKHGGIVNQTTEES